MKWRYAPWWQWAWFFFFLSFAVVAMHWHTDDGSKQDLSISQSHLSICSSVGLCMEMRWEENRPCPCMLTVPPWMNWGDQLAVSENDGDGWSASSPACSWLPDCEESHTHLPLHCVEQKSKASVLMILNDQAASTAATAMLMFHFEWWVPLNTREQNTSSMWLDLPSSW